MKLKVEERIPRAVSEGKEALVLNPFYRPFAEVAALLELALPESMVQEADARLERFAPMIERLYPETAQWHGLIESPLREISGMREAMGARCGYDLPGRFFLKLDSHLPIAGSIKARGGVYEVLKHAETIALESGLLKPGDSYEKLADPQFRELFSQYTVQAGSTGNLGLSIGIMSAAVGFRVRIHMSADARQWKKDLLRAKGVEVIEYAGDYSAAVAQGRAESDADPKSHFVDDEHSLDLFMGYAVAGDRIKRQFAEEGIPVDSMHPLFVYLPAGVGGAPGGISYRLKQLFGDHVHLFWVEPTQCPSVLLGVLSQKHEKANVRDFGLSGETQADGLACASPSGLVTRACGNLISAFLTVEDASLFHYLRLLKESEDLLIEPSSCSVFAGMRAPLGGNFLRYLSAHGLDRRRLEGATHLFWSSGGALVPEPVWDEYLSL